MDTTTTKKPTKEFEKTEKLLEKYPIKGGLITKPKESHWKRGETGFDYPSRKPANSCVDK